MVTYSNNAAPLCYPGAALTRRVLVCIQDTGVAHVVASRLQKDGVDAVVVDGPAALGERGDPAEAAVLQDRYPDGTLGRELLNDLRTRLGDRLRAVYLLTGDLGTGEEENLRAVGVESFLRTEATPHSIARAAADAASKASAGGDDPKDDLELDIVLHEDEDEDEFDISVDSTAAEVKALTFDSGSDERTVEVAAIHIEELRKNLGKELPTPSFKSEPNPTVKVKVPQPLDSLTLDGATFDGSELLKEIEDEIAEDQIEDDLAEGAADHFELPSLPPTGADDPDRVPTATESSTAMSTPLPVSAAEQAHFAEPPPTVNSDEGEALAALDAIATADKPADAPERATKEKVSDDVRDDLAADISPADDAGNEESERNEAMQMQELKKALLAQQKARKTAEERVKELEVRLTALEPADNKSSEGVPEEGALEDIRYPVLLSRCRSEGYTGTIVLHIGDQATRTIYLKDGLPVGFASSEPGERIGKMMVEQGRITDEQYVKASMAMVERGIRLTEAMVELGFIEGEKLAVEMRNLTRDQIIQGFETTQGRFKTNKDQLPDDSVAVFDFGPGEIYVQGYRKYAPKQEMLSLFESLRDTYLKASERLPSFRPKLGLTTDDERLIRLLGEAYTIEDSVDQAELDPEAASRLLAALQALDLVVDWSPGVEQFQARLKTERQKHAEEIARIREETSAREKELFQGFERALEKIGSVTSGGAAGASPFSAPAPAEPVSSTYSSGPSSVPAEPASPPPQSDPVVLTPPPPVDSPPEPSNGVSNGASYPGVDVGTPPSDADGPLSPADEKYAEGLEQARQNKLDEAEVTLREAVRMDATKPHYLLSLARVLLENPRYERAGTLPVVRSLLDRAVQIAPADSDVQALHEEVVQEMGG